MSHLLDRLGSFAMRFATGRLAVFPDGLGHPAPERLADLIPRPSDAIAPIHLDWRERAVADGLVRSQAEYESPFAAHLPAAARRGFVERIEPVSGVRRVIVLLQMWGDEGLSRRRELGCRLARRGVATVLPVHPFYGRRRVHREGPAVRSVEEFMRMGLGSIAEVRGLLGELRRSYEVGLGGFSMGSGFSVGASTTLPFPVALTLMGAAPSPAKAFTEGVLARGLPDSLRTAEARSHLRAALDSVSALARPVLPHHRRAVILAARGDGFVPVDEADALARHWRGAELRIVSGGHATLWFCRRRDMVAAILRSFERCRPVVSGS